MNLQMQFMLIAEVSTLVKQNFHEDMKKVFEPVTKSMKNASEDVTKTITETSKDNNESVDNIKDKLLKKRTIGV